jgi:uncharacterized protein (UPF0332 family)
MSATPSEVFELASSLLKSGVDGVPTGEVTLRCSASRAYYAALHAADLSLPSDLTIKAGDRKGKSSHQAVIDAVIVWAKAIRPGRTEAGTVARNLVKLRNFRKKADYHLESGFTENEAAEALEIAAATLESATRAARMAEDKQA